MRPQVRRCERHSSIIESPAMQRLLPAVLAAGPQLWCDDGRVPS